MTAFQKTPLEKQKGKPQTEREDIYNKYILQVLNILSI